MIKIDKMSVVDPTAKIGENCIIGPFCTVGANVTIGANTILRSHVVVDPYTEIGDDTEIFPFATIGIQSQDQKHVPDTITYTRIGARNIIREFVSIHSGTEAGSITSIGDDCTLLAHAHVAHNCEVGNHVVLSHSATLGGHVTIGDQIGRAAMVGGMSRTIQDVLPFTIAEGFPAHMRVINKVGMERAGYSAADIAEVRKAFRILFMRELRLEVAVQQAIDEFPNSPNVRLMIDAINSSQRGLARPDSAMFEINVSE